jgi:hypothetical protein
MFLLGRAIAAMARSQLHQVPLVSRPTNSVPRGCHVRACRRCWHVPPAPLAPTRYKRPRAPHDARPAPPFSFSPTHRPSPHIPPSLPPPFRCEKPTTALPLQIIICFVPFIRELLQCLLVLLHGHLTHPRDRRPATVLESRGEATTIAGEQPKAVAIHRSSLLSRKCRHTT